MERNFNEDNTHHNKYGNQTHYFSIFQIVQYNTLFSKIITRLCIVPLDLLIFLHISKNLQNKKRQVSPPF